MKPLPLTLPAESGAVPIHQADLERFGIKDDARLEVKTVGPWHIPVSITGLTVSSTMSETHWGQRTFKDYTLHGIRAMSKPKSCGYEMEGWVSLNGKKRSAFTSSMMFCVIETKALVQVGCLHVRS